MAREYLISDFLKRIKRPIELEDQVEYKLVTVKMNHNGVVLRENKMGGDIKSNMFLVKTGDFILSGIDARNGAFGIIPEELNNAIVTNDFWYFEIDEELISKELFLELTATTWFDEICKKGSDGTTQRIRLQKDKFFNQTVWLPEKKEQDEILNKIKTFKQKLELLKYEHQIQNDSLSQLRQGILQEAIQGKLTKEGREQNPNTEPSTELLKRIKAEKETLIKEKKIKKEKPLAPISEDEIPFELPNGWVWSILDECALFKNGKAHEQYVDPNGDFVLINSKFVSTNGEVKKHTNELLLPMYKNEIAIVMSDVPGGRALSRCYLIEEDNKYSLNQRIGGLMPFNEINPKYLLIVLDRNSHYLNFDDGKKQTNLTKNEILTCPIPLPPFDEQCFIVEKVEEIIGKCTLLSLEIENLNNHSKNLLKALFNETFEVKTEVCQD
jgi:restriction endonuclease S subunit